MYIYIKYNLEEIFPPVGLELLPVALDDVKEDGQATGSHVKLTPAHDTTEIDKRINTR